MTSEIRAVCDLLSAANDILIIGHQKPDGDAYGAGFALLWALERLGKRARVITPDGYDDRYRFLFGNYTPADFSPAYVVTTDIASPELLGELEAVWGDKIDLCIDHHRSNTLAARHKLVDPEVPATCQLIYHIIRTLKMPFDPRMATAIFTGISTDTGCFRFDNVTAETHRIAAEMIDAGADHALVNKLMFDTKSRARLAIDAIIMQTLEYHFEGRAALITITAEAIRTTGVTDTELDGVSSIPRKIEGVLAGITLKEKPEGSGWRISLRAGGGLDAAAICVRLGGGGHRGAAGCTVEGSREMARKAILAEVEKDLKALEKAGP